MGVVRKSLREGGGLFWLPRAVGIEKNGEGLTKG